ncbi:MAG: RNase adapter RapZ [Trichloromonadaceae bacterium]
MKPAQRLILITGLSGSGKSSAARALEDEGFFVVDNLPLTLLTQFLTLIQQGTAAASDVAVVIDVRNREFLAAVEKTLDEVRAGGFPLEIYFFDASDEILIRRYSETRRRHPLAAKDTVAEGISLERRQLAFLRNQATVIVDSTQLTVHQLRDKVVNIARGKDGGSPLQVQLLSFGFRYGLPPGSDVVMDVRFIPNPYFIPELQPFTGLDRAVSDYVLSQTSCQDFLQRFRDLLLYLLPQYQREGKSYLTISIGCTGGRHRSVTIVENLRPFLIGEGVALKVCHRDIEKR